MPRRVPPFVEMWRDRHGKWRTYGRPSRKGPRIPLPDVGTEEFKEAYAKMLAGQLEPRRERPATPAPGTLAALVVSYLRSASYAALRQTTKTGYASRIETLRTEHGHRSVAGLTRERIINGILAPYATRPGASLSILKMLRVLIRHAIEIGWLERDPSIGIRRPKTQEIRSWTDAEIAIFENHWPIGTKQRLAFELMLNTGQRRSDVHRMTWGDVSDRAIRVAQQKTNTKLVIPLHRRLRDVLALAARSRKHVTIIATA